jgi:hypothetical protein
MRFGERKDQLESFTISSIGSINQTFSHTSFELFKRNSLAGLIARNSQVCETANRKANILAEILLGG